MSPQLGGPVPAGQILFCHTIGLSQLGTARSARVAAVLPVCDRPVEVAAECIALAASADGVSAGFFVVVAVAALFLA